MSLSIDPRRYPLVDEKPGYGGPPVGLQQSAPASVSTTSVVRYEGALREFSNKLPERPQTYKKYFRSPLWNLPPVLKIMPSSHASTLPPPTPFERYATKNNARGSYSVSHTNITDTNYASRTTNTSRANSDDLNGDRHTTQHFSETEKPFRKATTSLKDLTADPWAQTKIDELKQKPADPVVESMVKMQDVVWEQIICVDQYMDEVKQYNASNIKNLEMQRNASLGPNASDDFNILQRFNYQIRMCVANPGLFTATWEMLKSMCEHSESLSEYIVSRSYSDDELKKNKLPAELVKSLKIKISRAAV